MIGIGTWKVKVNTLMLKAEGTVEIIDNNGLTFRQRLRATR